ncbi:hypothetical protein GCM10028807_27050 [Spirosoma daeguense]
MNLLTSFALAAGLIVVSTFPKINSFSTLTSQSVFTTPVAVTADPGLTKLLPPVYFCGESVPLHEEAVARQLVTALLRNTAHNQALLRIRQRSAVFFPVIEPILAQYNIPSDFKYLPLVESALTGTAVSSKGAAGYWQFMPATARELGLTIRNGVDERQNLIKSTDAACRYLRYLYTRLGSWTLAAAAYNNGIGALLVNIRRQQQRDYYYLRLNAETGKYLYRILAFKELFSNARSYQHLIPNQMMAYLQAPLSVDEETNTDEVLLSETMVNEVTKTAVTSETLRPEAPPDEIPLPNAAEVFRGGIKAKLVESSGVIRGQTWVFHLTRNGMADGREVDEGDILYAVIEDLDVKTNKIYLRADKLYSPSEKHTYSLTLSAVDASTGRIGIKVPDIDQIRAGWILTWKAL